MASKDSRGNPHHEHDARWTAVDEYMNAHLLAPSRNPFHEALQFARSNSLSKGLSDIAVFAGQGKLLAMQIKLTGAQNILEVGTLGGYSAIWMASAGDNVKVTTVEVDPEAKAVAEENIAHAGLSDRVTVLLGPGLEVLPQLQKEVQDGKLPPFDFAFIDADKENNLAYFNYTMDMIKPRSLIYVDNVVRRGMVVDEKYVKGDARIQGIRKLIEAVGKDDRVDAVAIQTVADKNYDGFLQALVK